MAKKKTKQGKRTGGKSPPRANATVAIISKTPDKKRLAELETVIERGLASFVEMGEALREIRDEQHYRAQSKTFEDYCLERFSFQKAHAYRLMDASAAVRAIEKSPIGDFSPRTESQARELIRLKEPEKQLAAWERVVKRVDGDPSKLTAEIVREEVAKILPANRTVSSAPAPQTPSAAPVAPNTESSCTAPSPVSSDADTTPEDSGDDAESLEAAVVHLEQCLDRAEANGFKPVVHQPEPDPEPVDEGAEFVATVETLCRDTDQIAARMKALKPSHFSYSIHIDSAISQVEAARKTLWQGRPAHVCPYCKGEPDGCKPCNNTGRVKKTVFDSGTKAVGEAA